MPDKIEVERALSERSVASSSASSISSTESEDENATREPDKKIDDSFYFQDAYFEVQDTIFKVHRREFETSSPVFKNIFAKTQGDTAEGRNSDKPIKFDGILAEDFRQLLKVMYRTGPIQVELANESLVNMDPERSSADRLTVMGWITVLSLATKWEMGFYRRAAIACLTSSTLGLVPEIKLHLAMKYRVKAWFIPALNKLAQRPEPMGCDEHTLLGIDCVLKLCAVRERFQHCTCLGTDKQRRPLSPVERQNYDFTSDIQDIFAKEIASLPEE